MDWGAKGRAVRLLLSASVTQRERKEEWIWDQMAPLENDWREWTELKQMNYIGCFFFLIELCPRDYHQGMRVKGKCMLWNEELFVHMGFLFMLWDLGAGFLLGGRDTAGSSRQLLCFDDIRMTKFCGLWLLMNENTGTSNDVYLCSHDRPGALLLFPL